MTASEAELLAKTKWSSLLQKRITHQYNYGGCVWPWDDPCDDWSEIGRAKNEPIQHHGSC